MIEAEQTEESGQTVRNDRLIAAAEQAHNYRDIRSLKDVNQHLLKELEHFFVSYHALSGSRFRVLGVKGPKRARRQLRRARRNRKSRNEREPGRE